MIPFYDPLRFILDENWPTNEKKYLNIFVYTKQLIAELINLFRNIMFVQQLCIIRLLIRFFFRSCFTQWPHSQVSKSHECFFSCLCLYSANSVNNAMIISFTACNWEMVFSFIFFWWFIRHGHFDKQEPHIFGTKNKTEIKFYVMIISMKWSNGINEIFEMRVDRNRMTQKEIEMFTFDVMWCVSISLLLSTRKNRWQIQLIWIWFTLNLIRSW